MGVYVPNSELALAEAPLLTPVMLCLLPLSCFGPLESKPLGISYYKKEKLLLHFDKLPAYPNI